MTHRRVLRWEVPVDDDWHEIGGGRVVFIANRGQLPGLTTGSVEVWTEEQLPDTWPATDALLPPRHVSRPPTGSRHSWPRWAS
jgi:hypothetical protein